MCKLIKENLEFPVRVQGAPSGIGSLIVHASGTWTWETINGRCGESYSIADGEVVCTFMGYDIDTPITAIQSIMAEVEETWLANDGGLTTAAIDVLKFGELVIAQLSKGEFEWIDSLDQFDTSTGAESDIISAAQKLS